MDQISYQKRAAFFRRSLKDTPVGGTVRCTGLDEPTLCSNLEARKMDCIDCGAAGMIVTESEEGKITFQGPGILRRER